MVLQAKESLYWCRSEIEFERSYEKLKLDPNISHDSLGAFYTFFELLSDRPRIKTVI